MPGVLHEVCQTAETAHFRHFPFIGQQEREINHAAD